MFSIHTMEVDEEKQEGPTVNDPFCKGNIPYCPTLFTIGIPRSNWWTPKPYPPHRPFNHSITLKPNLEPVNIHAYRYPPIQKSEIEKHVKSMLNASLIQPS